MSRLAATLLCACAALPLGCAENQETLIVLFAPAWGDDGECVIDPDADEALLFGVLDVSFQTPYLMPAIVLNNSGEQAVNDNNTGVMSNEIQIKEAQVTLDSPQLPKLTDSLDDALVKFTAPLSTNSIPPGEQAGVAVEVIPLATSIALRQGMTGLVPPGAKVTVRANVVFTGTRSGNDVGKVGRVKARDFSFPITLCEGCLYTCASCDMGECPVEGGGVSGGICGNAQDFLLYPSSCEPPE